MEEVRIDVRDVDYSWFQDVKAWLDRDFDLYYLPRESAERLGEQDKESDDYWLLDGRVQARADSVEVDGASVEAWCVSVGQLIVRPAEQRA